MFGPWLLISSLALALTAGALLWCAQPPPADAEQIAATYDLTPDQARAIALGVPSDEVLAYGPGCKLDELYAGEFGYRFICEVSP